VATKKVYGLGALGVNVDTDPWSVDDRECLKMQNAQNYPAGVLSHRPGFANVNLSAAPGAILGGISVPALAGSSGGDGSGTRIMYIGRGPLSE
jgi:hypothetical protein